MLTSLDWLEECGGGENPKVRMLRRVFHRLCRICDGLDGLGALRGRRAARMAWGMKVEFVKFMSWSCDPNVFPDRRWCLLSPGRR